MPLWPLVGDTKSQRETKMHHIDPRSVIDESEPRLINQGFEDGQNMKEIQKFLLFRGLRLECPG